MILKHLKKHPFALLRDIQKALRNVGIKESKTTISYHIHALADEGYEEAINWIGKNQRGQSNNATTLEEMNISDTKPLPDSHFPPKKTLYPTTPSTFLFTVLGVARRNFLIPACHHPHPQPSHHIPPKKDNKHDFLPENQSPLTEIPIFDYEVRLITPAGQLHFFNLQVNKYIDYEQRLLTPM